MSTPDKPKPNPIDGVLDQMEQLMQLFNSLQMKPFPKELPPQTMEYLNNIAKLSEMYNEMMKNLIQDAGLSPKDLNKIISSPSSTLDLETKRRLERTKKIKTELDNSQKLVRKMQESRGKFILPKKNKKQEAKASTSQQTQIKGMRKGWKKL
jgi:hypothetical protein